MEDLRTGQLRLATSDHLQLTMISALSGSCAALAAADKKNKAKVIALRKFILSSILLDNEVERFYNHNRTVNARVEMGRSSQNFITVHRRCAVISLCVGVWE